LAGLVEVRTVERSFSWLPHMLPPRMIRWVSKTVVSIHSQAFPA
jgi:hypothetical protein